MNAQEKRFKLAELRGWKLGKRQYQNLPHEEWYWFYTNAESGFEPATEEDRENLRYWQGISPGGSALPDYCGDLNETHKVEVELTYTQHQKFRNELAGICGFNYDRPDKSKKDHHRHYVSATAEQRAEALIIALS